MGNSIEEWTQDIHQGDAVETLAEMPESSVHCVMTSPPYFGLRDYGVDGQIGLEESLDEYIQSLVDVADELRRVIRSDGSWWLNLGDSFAGSGRGQWSGEDERQKEAYTPDAGEFPERREQLRRKSKMLVPHRVAIALQDAGWIVRSDAVWAKPNPMPHPVKDRLNEHKEFVFHLTPEPDYWFDLDSIREPHKSASISRSKYGYTSAGNGSSEMPNEKREDVSITNDSDLHPSGKNPGDVFEISVKAFPDAHFAVYPPELCEKPIKSTCPPKVCADCGTPHERVVEREPGKYDYTDRMEEMGEFGRAQASGTVKELPKAEYKGWKQNCECGTQSTKPGIVLDPFAGAGTTAVVAKRLGRRFIGIDLNEEYVAMAQKRVGVTVDNPDLLLSESETSLLAYTDGGTN